jgi:hypothetical protein
MLDVQRGDGMSLHENIDQLMAEIGPAADLLVVDAYPSQRMWHIAMDEETPMFAELVEARAMLVLSADVGRPPASARASLHELFLRYAHVWDATGGLRMSLDEAAGSVWLLLDCAARELTLGALQDQLAAFTQKVKAWREIVATRGEALAQPGGIELLLNSAIRA